MFGSCFKTLAVSLVSDLFSWFEGTTDGKETTYVLTIENVSFGQIMFCSNKLM